MITPKQRRLLAGAASTVGVALAIGGLWYLWRFVQDLAWAELWTSLTAWQIGAVFLLVPVMALGNTWLASSWRAILGDVGGTLSPARAHAIFSLTHLARYLPGNVVHIAGRQVLAMRAGVPAWAAAKSLTLEMALLVSSSAAFAGLVWWAGPKQAGSLAVAVLLMLGMLGLGVWALKRWGYRGAAQALVFLCAFHLLGGLVFAGLLVVLGAQPSDTATYGYWVAGYVASWLLGVVTPGSPAGLGVREAVLVGLLQSTVSAMTTLAAAVVLIRLMGMLADIFYWLVAQFVVGFRRT
jgi:uncharacterized membrane protein YbhN (UPF0104 family)